MINIIEIKRDFLNRIEKTIFIDSLRELERTMIGYYSHNEITFLTAAKRKVIEIRASKQYKGKGEICLARPDYEGVFEVRSRFESVAIIDGFIISFGCYSTAEKAHKVYLREKDNRKWINFNKKIVEPELQASTFYESCKNNSIANSIVLRG